MRRSIGRSSRRSSATTHAGSGPATEAGAMRAEVARRLIAVGKGGGPTIVDRLRRAAAIVVSMPVVVA